MSKQWWQKIRAFCIIMCLVHSINVNAKDILVTAMGAKGDGRTLNTAFIQKAIDVCHSSGGGKVIFKPGNYLTGTIAFKDNVTLYLENGATILGSTKLKDYANEDPFNDGLGVAVGWALIVGVDKHNIAIEGAGAINGQGTAIKKRQITTDHRPESQRWGRRPFLLRLVRCNTIKIRGVKLLYSAAWTAHYFQCTNLLIEDLKIESHGVAHNDGIDIDGCQEVNIRNCDIYSGDDALCFKTTSSKMACKNITVSGMRLRSNQAGIKMGTESMADFEKISIRDCYIYQTRNGGIKLLSVDGAHIRDIRISDVKMKEVRTPVLLRLGSRLSVFRKDIYTRQRTGSLENVILENINAVAADSAQLKPPSGILITGVPGHPIKNLVLRNIAIQLLGTGTQKDASVQVPEAIDKYPEVKTFGPTIPAYGLWARHVDGMKIAGVRFQVKENDLRPAIIGEDVQHIRISDCRLPEIHNALSMVRFTKAADVHIERVRTAGTAQYLYWPAK